MRIALRMRKGVKSLTWRVTMAGGNGHARVPFLAQDRKADSRSPEQWLFPTGLFNGMSKNLYQARRREPLRGLDDGS